MGKNLNENNKDLGFAFSKQNYMFLAAALVIVVIGFLLMSGGGSENPNDFSDKIFSFRRITLAPVVVLAGFVFGIVAILRKPKD